MARVRFRRWDCRVVKGNYPLGGMPYLELRDARDGSAVAVATVNIPDAAFLLGKDEVFIKDYSENEGMLQALVDAGVVEDTGRRTQTGYVTVPICKLLI